MSGIEEEYKKLSQREILEAYNLQRENSNYEEWKNYYSLVQEKENEVPYEEYNEIEELELLLNSEEKVSDLNEEFNSVAENIVGHIENLRTPEINVDKYEEVQGNIISFYSDLEKEEKVETRVEEEAPSSNLLKELVEVEEEFTIEETIKEEVEEENLLDVFHNLKEVTNLEVAKEPIIIPNNLHMDYEINDDTIDINIKNFDGISEFIEGHEFDDSLYPSCSIKDFKEENNKNIVYPVEYSNLQEFDLNKGINWGKVNVSCGGINIYNIGFKTHNVDGGILMEFKGRELQFKVFAEPYGKDFKIKNFQYRVSENLNPIKAKLSYKFFKSFFKGKEFIYKNKRIEGSLNFIFYSELTNLNRILNLINKTDFIINELKIKHNSYTISELIEHKKSINILYAYLSKQDIISSGNIAVKVIKNENINVEKLSSARITLPIKVNFLGHETEISKVINTSILPEDLKVNEERIVFQKLNTELNIKYS